MLNNYPVFVPVLVGRDKDVKLLGCLALNDKFMMFKCEPRISWQAS